MYPGGPNNPDRGFTELETAPAFPPFVHLWDGWTLWFDEEQPEGEQWQAVGDGKRVKARTKSDLVDGILVAIAEHAECRKYQPCEGGGWKVTDVVDKLRY